MNSRKAYTSAGLALGALLLAHAFTAQAAPDESAGQARQPPASYAELKRQALADEPLQAGSPEEIRRQSQRQNAAIRHEMRRQAAAAKDAAVREEAARLIMERAEKN
jgi:hypothetical protein